MKTTKNITVSTVIGADKNLVWLFWTTPEHIENWNFASPDWHCPKAANDLQKNGRFTYRMEAKDGSMGFDMTGTYDAIRPKEHIAYTMDDGRKVSIDFLEENGSVTVVETFEPESQNPLEMQRQGWQAILDNFKKHVESN